LDALSEVLRLARFGASITLDATAHHPWCVSVPAAPRLMRAHILLDGAAQLAVANQDPIAIEPGELVLLPHGQAHLIGSDLEARAVSIASLERNVIAGEMVPIRVGGPGAAVRWIALSASCEPHLAQPLLDELPPVVRVAMVGAPALNGLLAALGLALSASDAPAMGAGLRRDLLATLIIVEALRRHVVQRPPQGRGWLDALSDRYVGRALAIVHGRPGEPWTVEKLGRQVGLSRSALAERFGQVMGEPIFAFLTRWRLQLAAEMLLTTPRAIESIAREAGYESAGAFSAAFKRQFRKPPSLWRRSRHRT
jgi:AraC-like DNA-binding protein